MRGSGFPGKGPEGPDSERGRGRSPRRHAARMRGPQPTGRSPPPCAPSAPASPGAGCAAAADPARRPGSRPRPSSGRPEARGLLRPRPPRRAAVYGLGSACGSGVAAAIGRPRRPLPECSAWRVIEERP